MANLPVVLFNYDFSPYGQKIRTVLHASKIDFKEVSQPVVLPRPDLTGLGVTYRRIPVLAIGKDVYCDSIMIIRILLKLHPGVPTSKADDAYDIFGKNAFGSFVPAMPTAGLDETFIKDRLTIFPMLASPHLPKLRPSALSELKATMATVQNDFLHGDSFIAGDKLTMADIHIVWVLRWFLFDMKLQQEPGFGPDAFPQLYEWFKRMPRYDADKIDVQTAHKTILNSSSYVDATLPFNDSDPLGIKKGSLVIVENRDTTPGAHPQAGRLIGLDTNEAVLELENGVRVHFPRVGYSISESSKL